MKLIIMVGLLTACLLLRAAEPKTTDPRATQETVNLYKNLFKLQSHGIMFGHQDDYVYGDGWLYEKGRSDIRDVCGDYPAVYGWELGHLELGQPLSLDSVLFTEIQEGVKTTYARGGVNTISWHLNNPLTGGTAWDVSSVKTVSSILSGGAKHALFLQYLDKLADFMLSLKTKEGVPIPIIFRPFHEHTGSWFWWGKNLCTPEEYKALWRLTVTYLRDERHVHNLLFAYSTDRFNTREEYLERYPGDDLIDIVAFDLYDRGPDYPAVLHNCAMLVSQIAAEKNKVGAVSEAGGPIAKNTEWWTKIVLESLKSVPLSWVLVWRNPWDRREEAFGPYKGHPSADDFVKFFEDPHTLFQKDIAPLKMYQ